MEENQGAWMRGLQSASNLLIRRGTAMGPLIPALLMSPFFVVGAFLFRSSLLISGILIFTAIAIIVMYFWHYSNFAKKDPDRLQSEEYRYGIKKMEMISSKESPFPIPANRLNISSATSNPMQPLPALEDIVILEERADSGEEK